MKRIHFVSILLFSSIPALADIKLGDIGKWQYIGTPTIHVADPIEQFWRDSEIRSYIRNYYFTRNYTNPKAVNQASYSLGGAFGILTAKFFSGFQVGATVYTAQPLGFNSNNTLQTDRTLPGTPLTALGELYLQYSRNHFLIRVGDQLINTPWLNPADSRMIPAAYRGIYATWTPTKAWTVTALRIYDFKSRVSSDFNGTNNYNPQNVGYVTAVGLANTQDPGAQAAGVEYKTDTLSGQIWGYQFFNFAKLLYADGQYVFTNKYEINPLIGAQALVEGGDGDNVLAQVSSGAANAKGYGLIVGVEMPRAKLTLAYNSLATDENAFNNGDVVSPYTSVTDPLYTSSMTAGLIEKSSGSAWKAAGTFFAYDKQLKIITSYAQYMTQPFFSNTTETDIDIGYTFKKTKNKLLKGLTIRNRLGIVSGIPAQGTFYYNRVMLQYDF